HRGSKGPIFKGFVLPSSVSCSENVPRNTPMFESSRFLDRDVKAERFKLSDMTPDGAFRMATVEVVGPKFVVRHAVVHDVVGDFEDLVAHGDHRLLVPPMTFHAVIAGLQRRAVLARGAEGGLN